jgi:hypothetical protein
VDQGHSDPKKQPKPSDSPQLKSSGTPRKPSALLRYSGLGMQLLFTIGLSAWGGYALDKYLGLKFPAFLLTFVFLSFGGSMYLLYRSLNNDSEH